VDVQLAGVTGFNRLVLDWAGGAAAKRHEAAAGKVPGADLSGVIVAVGEGVDRWKVGDEAFGICFSPVRWLCRPHHHRFTYFSRCAKAGDGTNQEYLTIPATSTIVPKPSNISHVEAASLPLVFLTSYVALVLRGRLDRSPGANARQASASPK
jgi:NADPH:quinone reductase-like Zn-dependent oxidoreductase